MKSNRLIRLAICLIAAMPREMKRCLNRLIR